MTREEIIRNLKYTMEKHKNDTVSTFDTNISVMCKDVLDYLEQEPCDAVSRECVLEVVNNPLNIKLDKIIENLPSVTPKQRTGKWINNHTQCSICEWGMEDDVVGSAMMLFFPYCPNCGAKMEGESE